MRKDSLSVPVSILLLFFEKALRTKAKYEGGVSQTLSLTV